MPKRPRSICFVAPFAYPVLARDRNAPFVGGAEVQQSLLAREFARQGWCVSMVCMDFGQPDGVEIDGITVHRMHAPDAGLPVLRFLHPRLTSLWAAMAKADADIYYQRAVGSLTGFVAAFARSRARLSVYAAAHDLDFDATLPLIPHARDRLICRWGLRNVSGIVTQSLRQQQACLQTLGRPSTVIHSVYAHRGAPANKAGPVIWVGNLAARKRPALVVELARLVPNRRFKIVGGGSAEQMARLRTLAAGLENIEFTGFVPYADVEQHFDGASVLVNTSTGEGFPNTFLQAWSRGIPTLSFFDADVSQDGRAVGPFVRDIPAMATALSEFSKSDGVAWADQSALCARYMLKNHRVELAFAAYQDLFTSIWNAGTLTHARQAWP